MGFEFFIPSVIAMHKTASGGAILYVQEELSDARLRCSELKRMISGVLDIVNKSDQKDHLYAVAGDVIISIPDTLLRLEKALEASALAVNKLDYEDLRQSLRPEKVESLERVLDEVRLRLPHRRGSK